jgi:hypothetical protein
MNASAPSRSPVTAASIGAGAASEAGLLVDCVARRADRRLAWLESLGERVGVADGPDGEADWQRDSEAGHLLSAAVERADAALAELPDGRFAAICRCFDIEGADRDLLITALAAQLDPALLALYHRMQGRPWTTEPLVARLFGHGRRALWRDDSPLKMWRMLTKGEAAPAEPAPLLLDPGLPHWLDGAVPVDAALVGYFEPLEPLPPLDEWPVAATAARVKALFDQGSAVRLILEGGAGHGRSTFAAAVASGLSHSAFAVGEIAQDTPWPLFWMLVQRHALAAGAMAIWRRPPAPRPSAPPPAPLQAICLEPGESLPGDVRAVDVRVALPAPGCDTRLRLLTRLVPKSAGWPDSDRLRLSDRPGLSVGDVATLGRARPSGAAEAETYLREASAQRLGDFAQRLPTGFDWDDLIVPPALREGLRDFAFEACTRAPFWEREEMRRLFPGGRGLVALFAGPPGTGKTMAAQIIARSIGVDLYRIDLATLLSKYIGETIKHLKSVFSRAASMHAVLLFDEADALFANRTDVKDSHDRYANTDTNYLLQQLESFESVALLATNRKTNIDTAFLRRIRYVYDFPRPDADDRKRLWRKLAQPILGTEGPELAPTLDAFGTDVELSGAQIKNALVAAYFAARRRGGDPAAADLMKGVSRELAKEGRSLSPRQRQRIGGHG